MIMQKSLTVLSGLLKRAPVEKKGLYLRFLPDSIAIQIQSDKTHKNPLSDLSLKEILGNIDDSWYLEKFRKFSKKDAAFFLSVLPASKKDSLGPKLELEKPFYSFSKSLELYTQNLLFREIFEEEPPLPLSFLPDSPLFFLCEASTKKIHKLAFYLGIFDISLELKSVLKGSIFKKLQATLFPDEVAFCREISEVRHVLSLGQIGLSQWNEDSDTLRKVIFERGLYRLSIGLTDASPDFIWMIMHSLDKTSALKLQKLPKVFVDPKSIAIIFEQTLTAWRHLCTVLS